MRIKMLKKVMVTGHQRPIPVKAVIDVEDREAKALITGGMAQDAGNAKLTDLEALFANDPGGNIRAAIATSGADNKAPGDKTIGTVKTGAKTDDKAGDAKTDDKAGDAKTDDKAGDAKTSK